MVDNKPLIELNHKLAHLGRLVVAFSAAEHSLRRVAWLLVGAGAERAAQIVLDGRETARIEELVRALVSHRVDDTALIVFMRW